MDKSNDMSVLKIVHGGNIGVFFFGDKGMNFADVDKLQLINAISNNFGNCDVYFFVDKKHEYFHNGIDGITTDIKTTNEYLRICMGKYKTTIFIGAIGMGGYASLLFGSKLKANIVIAFLPTTKLDSLEMKQEIINVYDKLNSKYVDLNKLINATTSYYVYYDRLNKYPETSFEHVTNIKNYPNMTTYTYDNLHVPVLYKSGELINIFKKYIQMPKTFCCC